MKAYEVKVKTESGRTFTLFLGHFETIQDANTEAMSGMYRNRMVGAVKITVQVRTPKISSRKRINSVG